MKALIGILCLAALAITGYGYWLHRSLHPLMSSKGVQAELKAFVAPNVTEPTEIINLGFARFEVPKSLVGVLTVQNDFFVVTSAGDSAEVKYSAGPPVSDDDPDIVQLLTASSQITGELVETSYALRKRSLSVHPFTVFDIPFKGRRQAAEDAALLLLKDTFSAGAPVVWQGETERVGLLWAEGERVNIITVFDKQKRVSQAFLLNPDSKQVAAFAATLLATYRFISDANDVTIWKADARKAGVHFQPEESNSGRGLLSEEERLERIAEEVRVLRAQRKASEQ